MPIHTWIDHLLSFHSTSSVVFFDRDFATVPHVTGIAFSKSYGHIHPKNRSQLLFGSCCMKRLKERFPCEYVRLTLCPYLRIRANVCDGAMATETEAFVYLNTALTETRPALGSRTLPCWPAVTNCQLLFWRQWREQYIRRFERIVFSVAVAGIAQFNEAQTSCQFSQCLSRLAYPRGERLWSKSLLLLCLSVFHLLALGAIGMENPCVWDRRKGVQIRSMIR